MIPHVKAVDKLTYIHVEKKPKHYHLQYEFINLYVLVQFVFHRRTIPCQFFLSVWCVTPHSNVPSWNQTSLLWGHKQDIKISILGFLLD